MGGALTQDHEVDLAPKVLPACLHFAVVVARVAQLEIVDQKRGVSVQVVSGEGQAACLVIVGVDLVVEKRDDLSEKRERERARKREKQMHRERVISKSES